MKTKKSTAKKIEKINTEPDEKEIRSSFLKSYTSTKSSAARLVTLALMQKDGSTVAELQNICREYAGKQSKPQKWGCSKRSDISSHFLWLRNRHGCKVELNEKTQRYTLTV